MKKRPITAAAIMKAYSALERLIYAPDFDEVFGLFDADVVNGWAALNQVYGNVADEERRAVGGEGL